VFEQAANALLAGAFRRSAARQCGLDQTTFLRCLRKIAEGSSDIVKIGMQNTEKYSRMIWRIWQHTVLIWWSNIMANLLKK